MMKVKFIAILLLSLLLFGCGGDGDSDLNKDSESSILDSENLQPLSSNKVLASESQAKTNNQISETSQPLTASQDLIDSLGVTPTTGETDVVASIIGFDPDGQWYLVEFSYIRDGSIQAQYVFRVETDIPISKIEKPPPPKPSTTSVIKIQE